MSDTWNAQDADTEPAPLVVEESWIDTEFGHRDALERIPMLFLDAIAIVACSVVLAKAVGLL